MTDSTSETAQPVCKFDEGCHRVVPCDPGCGTPWLVLRDRIAAKKAEPAFRELAKALSAPVNLSVVRAAVLGEAVAALEEERDRTDVNVAVYPRYDQQQRNAFDSGIRVLRQLATEAQQTEPETSAGPTDEDIRAAMAEAVEGVILPATWRAWFGRSLDAALAAVLPLAAQLRQERDLAIAHDRQPYPTAWAYEQACAALRRKTDILDKVGALGQAWSRPAMTAPTRAAGEHLLRLLGAEGEQPDDYEATTGHLVTCLAVAGGAADPECPCAAGEPTEEQVVSEHVTTLHLMGEQLAAVENWMWQRLAEVRAAAPAAPVGAAAGDEKPGWDLLRDCECGGSIPHPDCPVHSTGTGARP